MMDRVHTATAKADGRSALSVEWLTAVFQESETGRYSYTHQYLRALVTNANTTLHEVTVC